MSGIQKFSFKLSALQAMFNRRDDADFLCYAVTELMVDSKQYHDRFSCSSKGLHTALYEAFPDVFVDPNIGRPSYANGGQQSYILGWIRPHVRFALNLSSSNKIGTRKHRIELLKMLLAMDDPMIEIRSFFDLYQRGIVFATE